MTKNSFVLQTRLKAVFAKLSDKQAGVLIKSIFNYADSGTVANFEDGMVGVVFEMVRQDIDYNNEKYNAVCEKRKAAIQKRWSDTNVYKCIQKHTSQYKSIHNDNDVDVVTNTSINACDSKKNRFCKPTVSEIKAYCESRNNGIDAQAFFDFYESKGWKVGNTPMKNWQAAINTWERRQKGGNNNATDYNGNDADRSKYVGFGRRLGDEA